MSTWLPFPLLIAASCLLSSCLVPAKARRVIVSPIKTLRDKPDPSTYDLLRKTLKEAPDSPEGTKALGQFVKEWKKDEMPSRGLVPDPANNSPRYQVQFDETSPGIYKLDYFDEVESAADYKITRIKRHERPGIGAPLMALRENKNREKIEQYFPPEAITRPLTAVAHPGPVRNGVQDVRISLVSPLQTDTVDYQGKRYPLAADFSIPWASALSRAGNLRRAGIMDMLTPTPKRRPQLYLMEPYDPNKEPLIMIHGLVSTPLAWANISNELWADDTIRKRYQIWHYLYNTSAPCLYSARILRAQLKELRSLLDPDGNDPAMQRTTLLTHSMGGILGKSLVVSPGDKFWNAAFTVPPEQLKLSPQDRVTLKDAFEWEPDRSIHRIIFICTPHKGSAFADNPIGLAGRLLTRPPNEFRQFYKRVSDENPGAFTPAYVGLANGKLDGVSSLSPRQPTLRILSDLPIPPSVRTHSIIGNKGWKGPLEKSSDNIVPYKSSHLESAESELVVPSGHGAFKHPKAMAEVLRILRLPPVASGNPTHKVVDSEPRYMRGNLRTSGGA